MTQIWSEGYRYSLWTKVQLAVLEARSGLKEGSPGAISPQVYEQVMLRAKEIDNAKLMARAKELEKTSGHDYASFVDALKEAFDCDLFHPDGMTSFDGEEPVNSLRIREALALIFEGMVELQNEIKDKARTYLGLPQVGRTHGQHGYPITLGFTFMGWLDELLEARDALVYVYESMEFTKLRGAMGTYTGILTPALEEKTLEILGLKPARYATQIISRSRHARVMNELAVLAGVLENIALNIRLLGQTEIREFQEPFKKGQKGSSVMSQKQNTDKSENACGLMSCIRGYAGIILEHVATWAQRSIEQSSPERICFPDAFELIYFTLRRLTYVIKEGRVNQKQIEKNLEMMQGTIYAADVKAFLVRSGMGSGEAYRLTQELAFRAVEEEHPYLELLLECPEIPDAFKNDELRACFDLADKIKRIPLVFERFQR